MHGKDLVYHAFISSEPYIYGSFIVHKQNLNRAYPLCKPCINFLFTVWQANPLQTAGSDIMVCPSFCCSGEALHDARWSS
jgi:hypothetical protein